MLSCSLKFIYEEEVMACNGGVFYLDYYTRTQTIKCQPASASKLFAEQLPTRS